MFAGVGDTENAGSISSMGQLLENTESGRDISEVRLDYVNMFPGTKCPHDGCWCRMGGG